MTLVKGTRGGKTVKPAAPRGLENGGDILGRRHLDDANQTGVNAHVEDVAVAWCVNIGLLLTEYCTHVIFLILAHPACKSHARLSPKKNGNKHTGEDNHIAGSKDRDYFGSISFKNIGNIAFNIGEHLNTWTVV